MKARPYLWLLLYLTYLVALLCFLSTPARADTLDVAIIGDDYLWMSDFQDDAEAVSAYIIAFAPFSEYQDRITFHIVPNQDDLYCAPSASMSRLVTCNESVVRNKLTALGVEWDKIIVLWNSDSYGGSGGSLTVVYTGGYMLPMVVHEFAHSLGGLLDEYLLYSTNAWEKDQSMANCWCMAKEGWFKGCNYPNWYRQSDCSIMKSLSCRYFNEISRERLRQRLDLYTAGPVVTLTAEPTEGRAPLLVTFTVTAQGEGLDYAWTF